MKNENRPKDTPFYQQRAKTYLADLNGYHLGGYILLLGIIFTPLGTTYLNDQQHNVYEQEIKYDSSSSSICRITSRNEGRNCQVNFVLSRDVSSDLYVYYTLTNFYQNHRRYVTSSSLLQLQGENLGESAVNLDCSPLLKNGSQLLNPCGLVANSFFNDQFKIDPSSSSSPYSLDETDISLASDRDSMYFQVQGFDYKLVNYANVTCAESGLPPSCKTYCENSVCYNFYYPDDSTVQYLYESYPGIISPIEGVTNEHFIVWMRPASLPNFRKLYGKIVGPFSAGDVITFNITANFEVSSFRGTKGLLLSSVGKFGGKNLFIGDLFLSCGIIFLIVGVLTIGKTYLNKIMMKKLN